jgi:hypothetical protein
MRGIALMVLALALALHASDTADKVEALVSIALVILSLSTYQKETQK